MIPTIQTDRMTLRPYTRSDWDAYFAFASSDRTQFMGGPQSDVAAWGWFTNDVSSWALNGFGNLALARDDQMIGFAGICQPPYCPEPELGWVLFDGNEGKGYATEAASAILNHTLNTTDLATVVSYIDPDNAASARVADRLGGVIDPDALTPFNDPTRVYRYTKDRSLS